MVTSAGFRSKAVVLQMFILFIVAPIVYRGLVFGPCF